MIDCKKNKKRSVEMSKAMLLSKQEMLMVQAGVAPILMRKDIYIYIFFSRYILKVESTGFLGGLDVGYERRIKDESSDLSRKVS